MVVWDHWDDFESLNVVGEGGLVKLTSNHLDLESGNW